MHHFITPRYLALLGASGVQVPVEHLLQHVGEQTGDDDDDHGEPDGAAGQQLDEDKIHVLRLDEGPAGHREGTGIDKAHKYAHRTIHTHSHANTIRYTSTF